MKLGWLRSGLPMQVEAELRELDPAEAEEYLQSLGATEGGLASLIKAAYRQLGLLTYFTTGTCPSQRNAQAQPACSCQSTWQSLLAPMRLASDPSACLLIRHCACRRERDEGVDHQDGHDGAAGGGRDPHRL